MNQETNLQLEYRKSLAKMYSNLSRREQNGFRGSEEKGALELFLEELKGLVEEHQQYSRAA